MKRFCCLISFGAFVVFIAGFQQTKAQTLEFAPVGAEWYYEYQSMITRGYVHISVESDTIIDGITCTKLTKVIHGYDYYNGLFERTIGNEYVIQVNDSVMIYHNGAFHLLFNFGASVGDTWTLIGKHGICEQSYGTTHVVEVGTDTISDNVLKYVKVLDEQGSQWGYCNYMGPGMPPLDTIKIIERIGPVGSYLLPSQNCMFDYSEGGSLRCYIDDDLGYNNFSWNLVNCGYINDQYQSTDENDIKQSLIVFPNPCKNIIRVLLNNDIYNNVCLYDMKGNIIYQNTNMGNNFDIDMSKYHKGLYLLKVYDGSCISTSTIIKQ